MSTFKRRFSLFVLAALVLTSLACGFSLGGSAEQPTTAPAATSPAQPTEKPASTQGPQATKPAAATQPAATQPAATQPAQKTQQAGNQVAPQLQNVDSNLEKLDSYRMSFVISVKGTDKSGKATDQSLNILQEIIRSKNQSHLQMGGTGLSTASVAGFLDLYQLDKQSYLFMQGKDQPAATCMTFSSDKPTFDSSALIKPDDLVKNIETEALVARGEMVNGIKTDHYKIRQAIVGIGASGTTGDLWIAQDGSYAVKFTGQSDGTFNITTDEIKGQLTMEYNLTNVNLLKEVVLPQECKEANQGLGDLPMPANATDLSNIGGIYTFKSVDKVAVVADFFRKELPGKGWKITDDNNLGADLVTLEVEKDTVKLNIMLTADGTGTSALITKQ